MAFQFVDLHCHSTASDGTLAPADLVKLAQEIGLSGLALTDHDTIAGIGEAASAAGALKLEFIPGIEISCQFPHPGTMHLLGYGVDPTSENINQLSNRLIQARDTRNPKIIAKLNELGVAISMQEIESEAGGTVVGRPHIAAVLLRKGYVSSIKNAFDKYLGTGRPAYFDKERLTARESIEMIRSAGGVAVLAHPCQLRASNDAELDRIVKDLLDLGVGGIEVIHSDHDAGMVERYTQLADRYNLLKTGGSDFHGGNKFDVKLGWANGRRIPRELFDALWTRIGGAR